MSNFAVASNPDSRIYMAIGSSSIQLHWQNLGLCHSLAKIKGDFI